MLGLWRAEGAEVVVEPVTLIGSALAAGALKGAGESATTAVKDAYIAIRTAMAARFAERHASANVLADHEVDPDTYERSLAETIQETGAAEDPRILELAQALMRLMDQDGTLAGKYTVDVRWGKGVQVGDHGTQHNTFG
jgi:hypothetical protein